MLRDFLASGLHLYHLKRRHVCRSWHLVSVSIQRRFYWSFQVEHLVIFFFWTPVNLVIFDRLCQYQHSYGNDHVGLASDTIVSLGALPVRYGKTQYTSQAFCTSWGLPKSPKERSLGLPLDSRCSLGDWEWQRMTVFIQQPIALTRTKFLRHWLRMLFEGLAILRL